MQAEGRLVGFPADHGTGCPVDEDLGGDELGKLSPAAHPNTPGQMDVSASKRDGAANKHLLGGARLRGVGAETAARFLRGDGSPCARVRCSQVSGERVARASSVRRRSARCLPATLQLQPLTAASARAAHPLRTPFHSNGCDPNDCFQ